jgi:hypothetical protein
MANAAKGRFSPGTAPADPGEAQPGSYMVMVSTNWSAGTVEHVDALS